VVVDKEYLIERNEIFGNQNITKILMEWLNKNNHNRLELYGKRRYLKPRKELEEMFSRYWEEY
jgi:hypothetical protein